MTELEKKSREILKYAEGINELSRGAILSNDNEIKKIKLDIARQRLSKLKEILIEYPSIKINIGEIESNINEAKLGMSVENFGGTKNKKTIYLSSIIITIIVSIGSYFFIQYHWAANDVRVEIKKPKELMTTPEPKPTPAELLTNAKKLLNEKPKYAPDDNSESYLWQAASILEFIKEGDKEYPEAQTLLKQIHAWQKNILERETEISMAIARKDYAKELEFIFLDKLHTDTTVTVSGKNNTIIKIKWILWSKVTVYEFFKDGKIMNTWRSMGFKKYVLTDGYRWTWAGNP